MHIEYTFLVGIHPTLHLCKEAKDQFSLHCTSPVSQPLTLLSSHILQNPILPLHAGLSSCTLIIHVIVDIFIFSLKVLC